MERISSALVEGKVFNLIIIGGGITGACMAADAAMRGLSVLLIEKRDFGSATSSASSKLLHGGIRYLQQLNILKVRESAQERIYFQQLAPHLTKYIPFIIPTYSSFSKSKFIMKAALKVYEFVCVGLNNILKDKAKRVPPSSFLSREELKKIVPELYAGDITGGVVFHESHMHSSERMTLGFIETAVHHGASAANYLEVLSFIGQEKGHVEGVIVKDLLKGKNFEIKSDIVVNATGPWIPVLNRKIESKQKIKGVVNAYSKGAHILTRQLSQYAVALPTKKQNQAVINRGGRHVFIIPWRGYSLIGTTYRPFEGDLDEVCATENDIDEMLGDINSALGSSDVSGVDAEILQRKDVIYAYAGIYPLIDDVINTNVYQGTGKYQIIDHSSSDNIQGLFSVFGAKYTTARLLAEKALDQIVPTLNVSSGRCKTRNARLISGDIDDLISFQNDQFSQYGSILPESIIQNLITNYGVNIHHIIDLIKEDASLAEELVAGRLILAAEVVYSVRNEMACHLSDLVFRRTGLGTLGNPGEPILRHCAELMAGELGWNLARINEEVQITLNEFP